MSLRSLANALPVIASALGDKLGVKVVAGNGAATNGEVITLPPLPFEETIEQQQARDKAVERAQKSLAAYYTPDEVERLSRLLREETKCLALGYIVHEGGGHVGHTDFTAAAGRSNLQHYVDNALEDIRVDGAASRKFPGCKIDNDNLVGIMSAKGLLGSDEGFSLPEEGGTPTNTVLNYMRYRLRRDVLGQSFVRPLAEMAEEQMKKLPTGMKVRLDALMFDVENCKTTSDVISLTDAIIKMMEEEAEKERQKEQEQEAESQQGQDQNTGQDQGGGESQDQGNGESQGSGQSDGDDDQDQGTGQGQQSQSGASEQGGNGSGGTQSQAEENQDGTEDGASSGGQMSGQSGSETIEQMLAAGAGEGGQEIGDIVRQSLDQVASRTGNASSVSLPPVAPFRGPNLSAFVIEAEKSRVVTATNALRVRAQSSLQARTLAHKQSTMVGHRLDIANMATAKLSGNWFQRKVAGIQTDTAVSLLIDRSGSMDAVLGLALDAALAATLALQIQGVRTRVSAFPFYVNGHNDGVAVLKDWAEQPAAAIPAYRTMRVFGSTPLAEALVRTGVDIMQQREPRRIIFVLTDGEPDDFDQAEYTLNLCRRSGIEVLGLGINIDVSRLFGGESREIRNLGDLPSAMIGMLQNALLKKAA